MKILPRLIAVMVGLAVVATLAAREHPDVKLGLPARMVPRSDDTLLGSLIAHGGQVRIPPGRYVTTQPIMVRGQSDLDIDLNGTVIVAAATQPVDPGHADTIRLVNCRRVHIHGGRLDGNASNRAPMGRDSSQATIGVWGCRDVSISGITFAGAVDDAIFVCALQGPDGPIADPASASQWVSITGNIFDGPAYRQHVSIVHGRHMRVSGNIFRDQTASYTGTAIDVEANPGDVAGVLADIAIRDNDFSNCINAVQLNGVSGPLDLSVTDNRFADGGRPIFSSAPGATIARNIIARPAGIAIACNAPATIDANRISDGHDIAVYLNPGAGPSLIRNNVVTNTAQPAGGSGPWVFQTRFGGGHETVLGNSVIFSPTRPDVTAYLLETATATASQNSQAGAQGPDGVQ